MTLLQKEKDGSLYKHSAFGDTEPLWMDNNVGPIDVESKVPVKQNMLKPINQQPGDVPSANTLGGVKFEDGRDNATTIQAGATSNGEVVPDAMPSSYKASSVRKHAFIQELMKIGEMSAQEAMHTLQRLDAADRSKLTPEQMAIYGGIGAIAGPTVGAAREFVKGNKYFGTAAGLKPKLRIIAGDALAGAVTSGAIPVVRSYLDRKASETKLKRYVQEVARPKTAGIAQSVGHFLPSTSAEHITDLAGLGLMAAGSASHLHQQLKGRDENDAVLKPATQSGLDLGGLATMAVPTVAAIAHMARGRVHPALAGGGKWFTNLANIGGLTSLAIPTADKLQAQWRAKPGEDLEHKMLLSDKVHKGMELAGYGALAAPVAGSLIKNKGGWGDVSQLAGYATLAAPHVLPIDGAARSGSELAGLGLLGLPVAASLRGHH